MRIDRNRATGRVLATALALTPAFLTATALAQAAGTDRGVKAATTTADGQAKAEFDKAQALSDAGQLVQCKAVLGRLVKSPELKTVPDALRDEILGLLQSVEIRIRDLDPLDLSLQKADQAMVEGDFVVAERQAHAVLNKRAVDPARKNRAQDVLKTVKERQTELSPLVANALDQVADDFVAGRYSQVVGGLMAIKATGVTLTEEQTHRFEQYQMRILDLQSTQKRVISPDPVGLAIFQPGVIRREKPGGEQPPPAPAPAPAPSNQTPSKAETPAPAPAPAKAQPEKRTEPPAAQPSQDDLIVRAMRLDAQRVMAEADQLMQEARYNLAQEKYATLLAAYRQYLTPEQATEAETKMAEARARMNQGGDIKGDTIKNITLVRDQTRVEFKNAMAEAERAMAGGDVARARDLVAGARLTYGRNKGSFNPQEQQTEFEKPLSDINLRIQKAESSIEQKEIQQREEDVRKRTEDQEKMLRSEKTRRINEAIDRARALQQEQKYEEALQVVDQILFLDNRNPTALLLRETLKGIVIYQKYWEIQREKGYRAAWQRLDALEDTIPPKGIMDYPNDWPQKSAERGDYGAFADTAENRSSLAKLERKIPVTFRDNTIRDVLNFINQNTDVNIDPEWDSLKDVGITEDTTVTFSLTSKLPARVVLDRILAKLSSGDALNKAGWSISDGVVRVASQEALNKDKTLVIYDIQDLLFDIPNYTEVPQIDLQSLLQQSQQGGGGGGQSPFRNDQDREQGRDKNRPSRDDRITLIRQIITSNVDQEGWVDNGGEVGTLQELNGSLIINNTPKNHREIVGLLSKLRQIRSMQINVETKFLLVNQSWFEQIGFDIDVVLNANSNVFRAIRAGQPNAQPVDLFGLGDAGASTGRGRTGLQRRVDPFDYNGDGDTADPGEGGVGAPNPRSWSPIGILQNSLGMAANLVEGDWASGLAAGAPALGIAGQFLDDVQVDFLVTATQADKRTVQLTAPRLTFTNGQTANIFVVTQQAFVSDLTPVVGDSAVGFDPTVSAASEGVTMLMEGVISSDRRYVTLNVDAAVGRIDGFESVPVTAVAGGQLVNSADTRSFIQLPTITVTRVRTSVTVPDEGTVLLGGQRLITELEIETGVPVLSKIPIINRFFTNRIESKEEQTLLILVKPTVLIQAEQEEKHFPGLADSLQTGLR